MSLLSLVVFCALLGAVRAKGRGAAIGAILAIPLFVGVLMVTQLTVAATP